MNFGNGTRAEHLLFVAPEWFPGAGARFCAKAYVASLVSSKVNCTEFYVKDHHGISYYDTRVGVRSSHMKGDYLAELLDEATAHNIEVIAYFSVCYDNYMAEKNPSWLMRTPNGDPILVGFWRYLCFNTPYRDYALQQLAEIARYPVKGFWLDILRFPELFRRGCFCNCCTRKYQEIYQRIAPIEHNCYDSNSRTYLKFLENSVTSFLREVREVVGDKEITFNGAGFLTPKAWNELCNWHNVESHAPQYIDQSYKARYLQSLRKSWEILTPGNNVGWSSWSAKPKDVLKLEFAIASSQGGIMTVGANPSIDGNVEVSRSTIGAQRKAIKNLYSWYEEREDWLKSGHRIANIAILQTLATHEAIVGGHPNPGLDEDLWRVAQAGQPAADYLREVILEGMGYHKALYDRGFQYEILNESSFDRLDDFETLILPDQRFVPEQMITRLRDFVFNGGKLIATHKTALLDKEGRNVDNFICKDLLGVDWLDVSNYSISYIEPKKAELEEELSDYVIPILHNSVLVKVHKETEVWANLLFPDTERCQTRFFFHEHSGPDTRQGRMYPMITFHAFGKGNVYYIAAPLGRDFFLREDPTIGQIIRNLVDLSATQVIKTTHGLGLEINLTYHAARNQVLIHLVNHYTNRNEPLIPCRVLHNIDLAVEEDTVRKYLGKEVSRMYLIPRQEKIRWQRRRKYLHLMIEHIEIYQIVVLE